MALAGELGGRTGGPVPVSPPPGHRGAPFGPRPGEAQADPPGPPGDQGGLPFELTVGHVRRLPLAERMLC